MKKVNVFIVALPTFDEVVEKIKDAVEDVFEKPSKKCFCCDDEDDDWDDDFEDEEEDFAPTRCCGTPPNDNLRFGYGLEVDEPRRQDYDDLGEFLEAREAFDDFVDSGERCVELGLDKRNDAPIHKCQAIRKPIGCKPPTGVDLIGESDFPWWEDDIDWCY